VSTDAFVLHGYRLTNLMMTGQSSQVWECVQEGTGRRYALKLLLPERVHDAEHRKYIATEAKVGRLLQHPKIIKVFEYFADKENPHFVMEFFPGANLKQRLMRKAEVVTQHATIIIEQAGEALAYMHDKGWLHKDIKPDNILVNGVGEVRLIDFALAEKIGGALSRLFSRKSSVKGTRSYMSPEQIRGERLDQRADVYSFGCMMFEVLCGRPPFRADSPKSLLEKHLYEKPRTPKSLNRDLTPEIDDLIMRMLAKNRKDRFDNMHEFLAKFRGVKVFAAAPQPGAKS
jgi:serine/threonine protein kinase